jgi:hypothetical protein
MRRGSSRARSKASASPPSRRRYAWSRSRSTPSTARAASRYRAAESSRAWRWRRSSSRSRGIRSFSPSTAPPPLARVERGVGRRERAGRLEAAERRGARARRRVDRLREEDDVGQQPCARVIRPGDPREDRAGVGPERVAADERLEVVVGVAGDEGADDGELVGPRREVREGAAETHAGDRRGDLPRRAADPLRPVHLRVERLDLARAAVQEEEDHRLPGQRPRHPLRMCLQGREVGEAQAARPECGGAPDPEEAPAGAPRIPVVEGQHVQPPPPLGPGDGPPRVSRDDGRLDGHPRHEPVTGRDSDSGRAESPRARPDRATPPILPALAPVVKRPTLRVGCLRTLASGGFGTPRGSPSLIPCARDPSGRGRPSSGNRSTARGRRARGAGGRRAAAGPSTSPPSVRTRAAGSPPRSRSCSPSWVVECASATT